MTVVKFPGTPKPRPDVPLTDRSIDDQCIIHADNLAFKYAKARAMKNTPERQELIDESLWRLYQLKELTPDTMLGIRVKAEAAVKLIGDRNPDPAGIIPALVSIVLHDIIWIAREPTVP
jgi:hypothetical protein